MVFKKVQMNASRCDIRRTKAPADLSAIVQSHRRFYGQVWGVGDQFADYVRSALAEIVERADSGDSAIWVAEAEGSFAGSVGMMARPPGDCQLRVLIVEPGLQGRGIGRALLRTALTFSRERGFGRVFLWTVRGLDAAAHLYREEGFALTEEVTHLVWGRLLTEERWEMSLL